VAGRTFERTAFNQHYAAAKDAAMAAEVIDMATLQMQRAARQGCFGSMPPATIDFEIREAPTPDDAAPMPDEASTVTIGC
jgi:hypothetical protein